MRAICRPQLFVKDMIIQNDTDTSEILISTFSAWQTEEDSVQFHLSQIIQGVTWSGWEEGIS